MLSMLCWNIKTLLAEHHHVTSGRETVVRTGPQAHEPRTSLRRRRQARAPRPRPADRADARGWWARGPVRTAHSRAVVMGPGSIGVAVFILHPIGGGGRSVP